MTATTEFPRIHTARWVGVIIAFIVLLLTATLFPVYVLSSANDHTNTTACRGLQRDWDVLTGVINTAYKTRSLGVDPSTLPPDTQRVLADLTPLLKVTAHVGQEVRRDLLKQVGPRPRC